MALEEKSLATIFVHFKLNFFVVGLVFATALYESPC